MLRNTYLLKLALPAALVLALSSAQAVGVSGQGTWESTLQGRDLDGNLANGYEAYYDAALNLTWLRDTNFALTSGYTSKANGGVTPGLVYDNKTKWTSGQMGWGAAKVWAATLNVNGVTGWRLPSMVDVGYDGCSSFTTAGGVGTDCGFNVDTQLSEMAHMWYLTLGNTARNMPNMPGTGLANTGPFAQLVPAYYWLDNDVWLEPSWTWAFGQYGGLQITTEKDHPLFAWAVHTGDVLPVPEPSSMVLMLMGLASIGRFVKRRGLASGVVRS